MRKIIALLLALSLLLCGCGGKEAPQSDIAAEAPVSEVASEVVEEPSVHEDGGPTDAVELAKWVWAKADEAADAVYATDFDLSILMEIDVDGTVTTSQTSSRVKEITTDTGVISYSKAESDGIAAEEWYADGVYYQVSQLGSFKTPMTQEEYDAQREAEASSDAVTDIYPENFGNLFATRNDGNYGVSFSEPTLDTWMAFSKMFTSEDQETATCTDFNLEGYMQCDLEGNVTQLKMEMMVALDLAGVPMTMNIVVNQLTMGYDEEVVIETPAEDPSFVELPNMVIPAVVMTGQAISDSLPSARYQTAFAMTLVEEAGTQVVIMADDITYGTDENGLSVTWTTTENINGEETYTKEETYANGQGLVVDTTGETPYSLTDEDMREIISEQTMIYTRTFPEGRNFEFGEDSGFPTLSYELNEEYVETTIQEYLTLYGVENLVTDGVITASSGSTVIGMGVGTMIVSQLTTLSAMIEVDGIPVEVTIQLACDLVEIPSDFVETVPEEATST